jgi:hypothetical protein
VPGGLTPGLWHLIGWNFDKHVAKHINTYQPVITKDLRMIINHISPLFLASWSLHVTSFYVYVFSHLWDWVIFQARGVPDHSFGGAWPRRVVWADASQHLSPCVGFASGQENPSREVGS